MQRRLVEHVQDVTLILWPISTAFKSRSTIVVVPNSSVVTRCNGIEAELISAIHQSIELQMSVAFDARVRCQTHPVRIDVRVDDVLCEVVGEVEHDVIDTELLRHTSGIVNIRHAAASSVALATPQPQGDADDLMALITQQRCCDR
jgi:hypothetical protein